MKINLTCRTQGNGLWSNIAKDVLIWKLELDSVEEDNKFGELEVYFKRSSWKIEDDGLIYTDPLFMKEFKEQLAKLGFSKKALKDLDYSEQGMQGDNYVSCDVGKHFIKEYNQIFIDSNYSKTFGIMTKL